MDEERESKNKGIFSLVFVLIIISCMIAASYIFIISPYLEHERTKEAALDRFKRTDWGFPSNVTLDWSHSFYPYSSDNHWWKTQVYLRFKDEPWNDCAWYLWLNFLDGDKYIIYPSVG